MKPLRGFAVALWLAATSIAASAADATPTADPSDTATALRALMAASNSRIPPASSCFGNYNQHGPATVKDLLAVQFGVLYSGSNIVQGRCDGARCELSIRHDNGEDLSSALIRFEQRRGAAVASTLSCAMTP